jgi:hypothetical protein
VTAASSLSPPQAFPLTLHFPLFTYPLPLLPPSLLFAASSDTQAHLWKVASGEIVRTYSGHRKAVTACALCDTISPPAPAPVAAAVAAPAATAAATGAGARVGARVDLTSPSSPPPRAAASAATAAPVTDGDPEISGGAREGRIRVAGEGAETGVGSGAGAGERGGGGVEGVQRGATPPTL